jgi:hypothetical protein
VNGKLPLITACEQCWRDGDAQASHEELQQEVNYGFRARSCYKQGTLLL